MGTCVDPSTEVVVDTMLDVLEYDRWIKNILALKRRIRNRPKVRVKRQQAAATVQTIEVTVPEGMGPGQAVAVSYMGNQYELLIPDGYGPGMVFQAQVQASA